MSFAWYRQPVFYSWLIAIPLCFSSGCAFDVSHLKQVPTHFEQSSNDKPRWTLLDDTTIWMGTGFPTRLRRGTHWSTAGRVTEGDVFRTSDQLVTIEASNIYEAMPVLKEGALIGFYLPVERTFAPATEPVTLHMAPGAES